MTISVVAVVWIAIVTAGVATAAAAAGVVVVVVVVVVVAIVFTCISSCESIVLSHNKKIKIRKKKKFKL